MKTQSSGPADDPSGRSSAVAKDGTLSLAFLGEKKRANKNLNVFKTGSKLLITVQHIWQAPNYHQSQTSWWELLHSLLESTAWICEGTYWAFLRPARDTGPGKACPAPPASSSLSALHCHAHIYRRKMDSKPIINGILKSKPMKIKWMCFLPSTTALLFNRGWTRWCLWAQLRIFNDSMINFNSSYPDACLKAAEDFNNTEKSKYDWRKSPQPTSPSSPACLTFSPIYND